MQAILTDANNQAIATAVIAMAEQMGMEVTAEGVESGEQLRYLQVRCGSSERAA